MVKSLWDFSNTEKGKYPCDNWQRAVSDSYQDGNRPDSRVNPAINEIVDMKAKLGRRIKPEDDADHGA